jgi:hypothetical protein
MVTTYEDLLANEEAAIIAECERQMEEENAATPLRKTLRVATSGR